MEAYIKMFKNKRAEMGVGTLIIFIAMLLVAAIAASVLIQTISSLQQKSLTTGEQATTQISTNAQTVEVSATNGQNGNLTDFQQLLKLSPGSDPIKLSQVIFTFNTNDKTSTLKYRGTDSICEKNDVDGYNTWNVEIVTSGINTIAIAPAYTLAEDFDDDSAADTAYVNATGDGLVINLSTAGLFNISLGMDLGVPGPITVTQTPITNGTIVYGYVEISGTTTDADSLNGSSVVITPYHIGEGYFSVTYEQTGTNWINGNLQRGDLIRLCYEAPGMLGEDEEVRLNFIPKIGTATLTLFVSPDVISTERVYLYP
jgi:flagellin FlaB